MDDLLDLYLTNIIYSEIEETLRYVSARYPAYFTKKDTRDIISKLNVTISDISEERKEKLKDKTKNKIEIRKNRNNGVYTCRRKTDLPDEDRCISRIWANGKISTINGKTIFGARCSKPRIDNSIGYCFMHYNNNPHMDFDQEPLLMIKNNYYKHNKQYRNKTVIKQ